MADDGQELCAKQRAWNADYYRFFDLLQRSLIDYGNIFPSLLDDIQAMIQKGKTAEALSTLKQTREELAAFFKQETEATQTHHRYLISAMENYRAMAEVLRKYSSANSDKEITQMVETQLAGIEDFTLAGIAHLDPER